MNSMKRRKTYEKNNHDAKPDDVYVSGDKALLRYVLLREKQKM